MGIVVLAWFWFLCGYPQDNLLILIEKMNNHTFFRRVVICGLCGYKPIQ